MFDHAAEELLAELEFYETDSIEEHQLKLNIIEEYNRRLAERSKRKEFTLKYKLLDSHYQLSLKPEQQKISQMFQPFMRFTKDHAEF